MKILFCYDGPLSKDEFNNYYGSALNDNLFKRYYSIAEELKVLIRVNEISKLEALSKLSKITLIPFKVRECPNLSNLKGLIFNKKIAKKIIKEEIEKTDYIVIRLPSIIGNLALLEAEKQNKKYLVEVVGCPWDSLWNHSFQGKIIAPYMWLKTKKNVKNAKNVVYVTNEFLQNRYPTKGKNTNCSNVALKEFDENNFKNRIKKINEYNYEDKFKIGTTAAINVRYKGQQYVIEALGKLKKQGIENFEYQLVGDGDQTYLKNIAKKFDVVNQIKFMGSLPHNEVFNWLENIDIYVQPSRQEGLPRALIEAMSKGLPAFGAKTGGIPELLDDEYIFSNTKKNITEITKILLNMRKKNLLEQSKRNFEKSKIYDSNIIEERRRNFFLDYKDSCYTKERGIKC